MVVKVDEAYKNMIELINIPNIKEKLEEEIFNIAMSSDVDANTMVYVDKNGNVRRYNGTIEDFLKELPNKYLSEWIITILPSFLKYLKEQDNPEKARSIIRNFIDSYSLYVEFLKVRYEKLEYLKDVFELYKLAMSIPFDLDDDTKKIIFQDGVFNRRIEVIERLKKQGFLTQEIVEKFLKEKDIQWFLGMIELNVHSRVYENINKLHKALDKLNPLHSSRDIQENNVLEVANDNLDNTENNLKERGLTR